ncbi:MAG: pilus assembly protein PilM [Bariatricus sp.]
MAKNILGIDIGHDRLKLVLMNGTQVKKSAVVSMPQKLLRGGRVVSQEAMAELIRTTMKKNGISCKNAALVLPDETVFVRNVTMPLMTADQLLYNLPYEFRDYITDELKDYIFDYAMITTPEEMAAKVKAPAEVNTDENADESVGGLEENRRTMDLFAVAAPVSLIEESKEMIRKAGLKLVKAAPAVCSYMSLIGKMEARQNVMDGEYGILDLGYQSIRMYMFRKDHHMVSRVLEIGLSLLDDVLADEYNVDVHLAHTYLLTNHENCQRKEVCMNAFERIAIELMRALNFYSFNNPDSQLKDIWICGGGAAIEPLKEAISRQLDIEIHPAEELLPGNNVPEECHGLIQAIGITQE